jgi:beta-mannosidase
MKTTCVKKLKWNKVLIVFLFIVSAVSVFAGTSGEGNKTNPAGHENLALYCPTKVSSTDHAPAISEFAVDGETDTGWRSGRSEPNSSGDNEWIMVDLQGLCRVDSVHLVWASRADRPVVENITSNGLLGGEQVAAYGAAYSIYFSMDGKDWTQVYATSLGSGGTEVVNFEPVETRFVRVIIHKRSHGCGIGLNELEVMGVCDTARQAADNWKLRRKPKTVSLPAASVDQDGTIPLHSGWELTREDWINLPAIRITDANLDTSAWYNAVVPGTVLTTLVEQGVFPEPTIGLNNLQIPESLSRHVWWYRTELAIPAEFQKEDRKIRLEFDGINHRAEVWFNTHRLGVMEGAFIRGKFDITDTLNKTGKNILAVRIIPPAHPGMALEKNEKDRLYNGGAMGTDSPNFLAGVGWDWMPAVRDRGIGIWNQVRIRSTGPVVIKDPQIVTDLPLPDTTRADISITVPVRNDSDRDQNVTVGAGFAQVAVSQTVSVPAHRSVDAVFTPASYPQLAVKNPKLWWPNGYGKQELYDLKLSAAIDNAVSDTRCLRFGVREFSYRTPKQSELEVSVNGRRVLCRGGNWGYPEMLMRIPRSRLEPAVRLHQQANLNMIRNWIGMTTQEDFYDLCDEYGILVWNDFWLANPLDGPNPDNHEMFMANVYDTVMHYRNHPSIVVWCGRNEGMPPEALDKGMRDLTAKLDGTRYYQPHSSDVGVSGGGPYKYMEPAYYFTEAKGFKTEIGMPSVPNAESMRQMANGREPWPVDILWAYHDFCANGNQHSDVYTAALEDNYGSAKGLDDFCRKAQIQNYEVYRAIFEARNHKMWSDCSGVMLWMSHPAWPSTVWQIYDYWFDTGGAFFGVKKANEPIHIQLSLDDWTIEAINHTAGPVEGTLSATIFGLDAVVKWQKSVSVTAAANSRTAGFVVEWPKDLPPAYVVKLKWCDSDGKLLSENLYWLGKEKGNLKLLDSMPRVKLQGTVSSVSDRDNETLVTVELANPDKDIALMTCLVLRNADTGKRILPAYYSDNYISLLPDEKKTITIICSKSDAAKKMNVTLDGWNVQNLTIPAWR